MQSHVVINVHMIAYVESAFPRRPGAQSANLRLCSLAQMIVNNVCKYIVQLEKSSTGRGPLKRISKATG